MFKLTHLRLLLFYTHGNTDHRGSAMRIIACYTTTIETKIFKTRLDGLLLDQFVPVTALAAAGVVLERRKRQLINKNKYYFL